MVLFKSTVKIVVGISTDGLAAERYLLLIIFLFWGGTAIYFGISIIDLKFYLLGNNLYLILKFDPF